MADGRRSLLLFDQEDRARGDAANMCRPQSERARQSHLIQRGIVHEAQAIDMLVRILGEKSQNPLASLRQEKDAVA